MKVERRLPLLVAIVVTAVLHPEIAPGQSAIDKIRITPGRNEGILRETQRRQPPQRQQQPPQEDIYDVVFENTIELDLSEVYVVVLAKAPTSADRSLPDDAYVEVLPVPPRGQVAGHSFKFVVDRNAPAPLVYVAAFGPQSPGPLWVRVQPQSSQLAAPQSHDELANNALALADNIAGAGNQDAADERYRNIIIKFANTAASRTAQTKLGLTDEQAQALQSRPETASPEKPSSAGAELAESARTIYRARQSQISAAESARRQQAEEEARLDATTVKTVITCDQCDGSGLISAEARQQLISAASASVAGTGGTRSYDLKCRKCGGAGQLITRVPRN